jgi:hypothetical protein
MPTTIHISIHYPSYTTSKPPELALDLLEAIFAWRG